MSKIYAFLADGFEVVECLAVVDVLRRAKLEVVTVSVTGKKEVESSHKVTVVADALWEEVDLSDAACLFLPGGMPGTLNLAAFRPLADALKAAQNREDCILAAICAAPSVLGQLGILVGKTCTCFPGFEDKLVEADYVTCGVVKDGRVITARGMGVAVDLGLALVEVLVSAEKSDEIRRAIQHPDTLPEKKIFC